MKTRITILILAVVTIYGQTAFGEVIIFRSRPAIEGAILKKTDTYIIVDNNGNPEKYDLEEIETIIDNNVNYGQDPYTAAFPAPLPMKDDPPGKTDVFFYGDSQESSRAEEMIKGVREDFDQHFLNK